MAKLLLSLFSVVGLVSIISPVKAQSTTPLDSYNYRFPYIVEMKTENIHIVTACDNRMTAWQGGDGTPANVSLRAEDGMNCSQYTLHPDNSITEDGPFPVDNNEGFSNGVGTLVNTLGDDVQLVKTNFNLLYTGSANLFLATTTHYSYTGYRSTPKIKNVKNLLTYSILVDNFNRSPSGDGAFEIYSCNSPIVFSPANVDRGYGIYEVPADTTCKYFIANTANNFKFTLDDWDGGNDGTFIHEGELFTNNNNTFYHTNLIKSSNFPINEKGTSNVAYASMASSFESEDSPTISDSLVSGIIDVFRNNLSSFLPLLFVIFGIKFGFFYVEKLGKKLITNWKDRQIQIGDRPITFNSSNGSWQYSNAKGYVFQSQSKSVAVESYDKEVNKFHQNQERKKRRKEFYQNAMKEQRKLDATFNKSLKDNRKALQRLDSFRNHNPLPMKESASHPGTFTSERNDQIGAKVSIKSHLHQLRHKGFKPS